MSEEFDNPILDGEDVSADLLTLLDEDGIEHDFEIIDMMEVEDDSYVALIPVQSEDSEESGELVILKSHYDENNEEFLLVIEDEAEYEKIAAIFIQRLSEEFDFEDDFN